MRSLTIFALALLLLPAALFGQDKNLFDSLHAQLAYARSDTERSDILRALAQGLEESDTSAARNYAEQAYQYARQANNLSRMARYDLFVGRLFSRGGQYESAR